MKAWFVALWAAPLLSWAQTPIPTEFPVDSVPITAESFGEKVVGRVFKGTTAAGQFWRLDFRSGGTMFWNRGGGASDSGKWRIEGDKLCIEMRRDPSTCNEFRLKDSVAYYKRVSNGEVVALSGE